MTDILGALPWSDFSFGGLLALAIVLIIRGDLVPRKVLATMTEDRDYWREHSIKLEAVITSLTIAAQTSARVLDALPPPQKEEDSDGTS